MQEEKPENEQNEIPLPILNIVGEDKKEKLKEERKKRKEEKRNKKIEKKLKKEQGMDIKDFFSKIY